MLLKLKIYEPSSVEQRFNHKLESFKKLFPNLGFFAISLQNNFNFLTKISWELRFDKDMSDKKMGDRDEWLRGMSDGEKKKIKGKKRIKW